MRTTLLLLPFLLLLTGSFAQKAASTDFPEGKVEGPFSWTSQIYPGTERDYYLYVPAQYNASRPAGVIIVQDGLGRAKGWGMIRAMDSLIARKEMPVVIGIFIDHGKVPAADPEMYPRFNRSFEYDARGDRYARFLIEEILPEVGRSYNLSEDPNDRCLAGASSGAIAAFNAAWERPDAFRRVLSTIGTYVGLRSGDVIPTLVRKTEPKPLRVFLEDGSGDLNNYTGDWFIANQDMLSALTWAGYEVNHIWGTEAHNSKGAKKIIGEALAWLWKDYPTPVRTHPENHKSLELVIDGENWKRLTGDSQQAAYLAVNAKGEVFFSAPKAKAIFHIDENGKAVFAHQLSFQPGGISFNAQGELCIADAKGSKIVALSPQGKFRTLVSGVQASTLALSDKGIYFTNPETDLVGFYGYANQEVSYVKVAGGPVGLALTADQTFLNVTVWNGVFGHSLQIDAKGRLAFGQDYAHYHIPYGQPFPGAHGITMDAENRSYTATTMGIQLGDQIGKMHFILSLPGKVPGEVKLGGADFDTLYLVCDGNIFARKVKAKGVLSWQPAVKPPKPGL